MQRMDLLQLQGRSVFRALLSRYSSILYKQNCNKPVRLIPAFSSPLTKAK